MPYSESDKLQREVEKLIEEIKTLKRPFILQPGSWLAIIGLIISFCINISQCSKVQNADANARIELAQSKLDKDKIQISIDSLRKAGDFLKKVRDSLKNEDTSLQEKYDIGKLQFANLQTQIKQAEELLAKLPSDTSKNATATSRVIGKLKVSLAEISVTNQNAAKSFQSTGFFTKNPLKNQPLAKDKEREGFQDFLNGDYESAVNAFRASENAYNGYHMVYELARLIKLNQAELYSNPEKKKEVIKIILNKLSGGAPQDLTDQLKETIR